MDYDVIRYVLRHSRFVLQNVEDRVFVLDVEDLDGHRGSGQPRVWSPVFGGNYEFVFLEWQEGQLECVNVIIPRV